MSDFDDEVTDDQDSPAVRQMRGQIKNLEKQLKERNEAAEKVQQLERENLVLRTPGLSDLNEVQRKMLFAAHDGEITPEALKATAEAAGFVKAAAPEIPAEELAAHDRAASASAGGSPVPAADKTAGILAAKTEDEFWAAADAAGVTDMHNVA